MIETQDELRAMFGSVHPLAQAKSRPGFDQYSRKFISMSPFLVISTADAQGRADLSPRGDPPGFVHIIDDQTMLIPDRPGNNRLDTMSNIMANPNLACLFFIPGFEETLRVNGRARLTKDEALLGLCVVNAKTPPVGIIVTVEEVFLHCAKALKRSRLWADDYRRDRASMPGIAQIILHQTSGSGVDENVAAAAERAVEQGYKDTLY
ncbi:MAG: MSMEG_1061 family FMN-dependent PPOX-type flavoprotein [Alphaproteobacteria bacterium]